MKTTKSKWEKMRMPEWRDGQPGCMECNRRGDWTELEIGMTVWMHEYLYYCPECAGKKRRKGAKA